jgi:nicotinate-nucleotide pyrophosphorylase (carboxylating)
MTHPANTKTISWDSPAMRALVQGALREDLGGDLLEQSGDHTANAIAAPDATARARIIAKQNLVLAGAPVVIRVFRHLDPGTRIEVAYEEGARVRAGECVARMEGKARAILSGERTALNFLAHLSGIATLTRQFVDAIEGTRAKIRDTRKTTPLHRAIEKYAARVGGGVNHRFGLYDAILIKENHIAIAGSVTEAIRRAHDHAVALAGGGQDVTPYESVGPGAQAEPLSIQVEVRNDAELREALAAGADSVLLDNVLPMQAVRLVKIVRELRPECVVEISGGVKLSNVRAFAEAGADFIAIGALTHSAPAADFTLLLDGVRD